MPVMIIEQLTFFLIVLVDFPSTFAKNCVPSVTEIGGTFTSSKSGVICSGDLVFDEEFNSLDLTLWNHELKHDGCGHNEFEEYVNDREISYVDDGTLKILPKIVGDVPLKDGFFNPVQSARMTTSGHFNFKFGKVEVRARLPSGDWLWPAIWLVSQTSPYGTWPLSGEIDIIEGRGNENLTQNGSNIGTELVFSTLHWGRNSSDNQYRKTHYEVRNSTRSYAEDFHLYNFEWTPDEIVFSIDQVEIGRVQPPDGGFFKFGHMSGENPWVNGTKMAPFDDHFYIVANVAIGGTSGYFPDDCKNVPGGKPWKNWSETASRDFWNSSSQWIPTWNLGSDSRALLVDYIKVWAL